MVYENIAKMKWEKFNILLLYKIEFCYNIKITYYYYHENKKRDF